MPNIMILLFFSAKVYHLPRKSAVHLVIRSYCLATFCFVVFAFLQLFHVTTGILNRVLRVQKK